jgi:hypothetical protein
MPAKIFFIDPFSVVFIDDKAVKVERVNGNIFGGFCKCGGIMFQKAWVGNTLLISECERCWRVEAFRFNGKRLIERLEVAVIDRSNLKDFLKEILASVEFEALEKKARNEQYNYNAYSRAKKKLEEFNLNVEEILRVLSLS